MRGLRRLANDRRARAEQRRFLVEGPVLLAEAIAAGLTIHDVFIEGTPDLGALPAGVPVHEVPEGTLAKVGSTVSPRPVVAVAEQPEQVVDPTGWTLVVVLAGVGDPGNAGTLVRSAEAAGADAVVFLPGSVDPYAPKTVRASAGALFHVAVVVGDHLDEVRAAGIRCLGTDAAAPRAYDEVDLTAPVAFLLGNEAHGVPPDVAHAVDEWVAIPMVGRAESLNVGMAGTVLCLSALRQRMRAGIVRRS